MPLCPSSKITVLDRWLSGFSLCALISMHANNLGTKSVSTQLSGVIFLY